MERLPSWLRQHLAALRALLVLTVIARRRLPARLITGVAQALFNGNANGSIIDSRTARRSAARSSARTSPTPTATRSAKYFQSRPSAAGDGYDPTSTSASNLGPEDIVDTLPVPGAKDDEGNPDEGKQSLLTQVCARVQGDRRAGRRQRRPAVLHRRTASARC